ncbi:chemotaxis protein CheR [candidate division KSB1 bacterium]|nr:MAG: chemotaxis protein CheR [candidate division KSB1 bacterium]
MYKAKTTIIRDVVLSENIFKKLGSFIQSECGIKMPPGKRLMVQSRLMKRLRALEISSFEEYWAFIQSTEGKDEVINLINAVSTNKTDFFREPDHFKYLIDTVLPELIKNRPSEIREPFKFWSAGCSTGEEPYTLAMVLSDFAEKNRSFKFKILATDISTKVIEHGRIAIYSKERIDPIPMKMKQKYLLKSKDPAKKVVRIIPELRSKVIFRRLNFLDNFRLKEKVEVIFCRNVVIYFDRDIQKKLVEKFYEQLVPGGFLFMGHSETINGLNTKFRTVAPTVYQK